MKLRYLHLEDEAPLQNITIPFGQETVLGRNCAIRFVVGVNGSGKSRLLRALTQLFLALELKPDNNPPFPVTLVYDLAYHPETGDAYPRTIFLHYAGRGSDCIWRAHQPAPNPPVPFTDPADWNTYLQTFPEIPVSAYGQKSTFFLPRTVLAYSSGLSRDWETLFAPVHNTPTVEQAELSEERPPHWSMTQEIQYLLSTEPELAQPLIEAQEKRDPEQYTLQESETKTGYFVSGPILRLAVCAVTLHQALIDFQNYPTEVEQRLFRQRVRDSLLSQKVQSGLRGLLNEVGWLWPVTFSLTLNTQGIDLGRLTRLIDEGRLKGSYTLPVEQRIPQKLGEIATCRIAEPEPGQAETFVFDLRAPLPDRTSRDNSTLAALLSFFDKRDDRETVTAFDIFRQLYLWHISGYLRELTMSLQKEGVDDLLLYDWLSDGEQLFLGRMALFHLLQEEQDALLIFDEPETHFNDVWKRRIVDIIDDSLRDQHHEVLISTHSSIALTDVFDTEITLLKNGVATRPAVRTFGASPSQLMIYLFNAPDSMGQRAMEYLDTQLDRTWTAHDIPELDNLLENLAAGYHRAELRAIRNRLNVAQD